MQKYGRILFKKSLQIKGVTILTKRQWLMSTNMIRTYGSNKKMLSWVSVKRNPLRGSTKILDWTQRLFQLKKVQEDATELINFSLSKVLKTHKAMVLVQ